MGRLQTGNHNAKFRTSSSYASLEHVKGLSAGRSYSSSHALLEDSYGSYVTSIAGYGSTWNEQEGENDIDNEQDFGVEFFDDTEDVDGEGYADVHTDGEGYADGNTYGDTDVQTDGESNRGGGCREGSERESENGNSAVESENGSSAVEYLHMESNRRIKLTTASVLETQETVAYANSCYTHAVSTPRSPRSALSPFASPIPVRTLSHSPISHSHSPEAFAAASAASAAASAVDIEVDSEAADERQRLHQHSDSPALSKDRPQDDMNDYHGSHGSQDERSLHSGDTFDVFFGDDETSSRTLFSRLLLLTHY